MAFDPNRTAQPGEVNYQAIDRWTLGHVAIGMGLGLAGTSFAATAVSAVAWEILERPTRARVILHSLAPHVYAGQDTTENSLWDVVGNMVGWWIGNQIRQRRRP